MTRPGFTTATQPSGEPLPEPMRVSAGFLLNGLSGKRLIHTLPLRRIFLVAAMRAASIWRLVTQPASSALSPNSPNCTVVCPVDLPRRWPRWWRRNFVLRGINISSRPPPASPRAVQEPPAQEPRLRQPLALEPLVLGPFAPRARPAGLPLRPAAPPGGRGAASVLAASHRGAGDAC